MKNHIRKVSKIAQEVDEGIRDIFIESVRQRGQSMEDAVNGGWYVPLLRKAEVMEAGLTATGYALNKPGLIGFGMGTTVMAGIQDYLIYRIKRGQKKQDRGD